MFWHFCSHGSYWNSFTLLFIHEGMLHTTCTRNINIKFLWSFFIVYFGIIIVIYVKYNSTVNVFTGFQKQMGPLILYQHTLSFKYKSNILRFPGLSLKLSFLRQGKGFWKCTCVSLSMKLLITSWFKPLPNSWSKERPFSEQKSNIQYSVIVIQCSSVLGSFFLVTKHFVRTQCFIFVMFVCVCTIFVKRLPANTDLKALMPITFSSPRSQLEVVYFLVSNESPYFSNCKSKISPSNSL